MDENELVRELKKHNIDTYEYIIDTYTNYVGKIIYSKIGHTMNKEDIEEVISDVFYDLWKNAKRINYKRGTIKSLLRVMAINKSINKLRELNYHEDISNISNVCSSDCIDELIYKNEIFATVLDLFSLLNEREQLIFYQYYFDNNSVYEISSSTGFKTNTIKSCLLRSRKKIKKAMEERGLSYDSF